MGDEPDVIPEPHTVTVVCPECGSLIRVRDVHAYLLAKHLSVCDEMILLNGADG